jgi:hypothetical protein
VQLLAARAQRTPFAQPERLGGAVFAAHSRCATGFRASSSGGAAGGDVPSAPPAAAAPQAVEIAVDRTGLYQEAGALLFALFRASRGVSERSFASRRQHARAARQRHAA